MAVTVKGTPNSAGATTVTIPTHAVGDMIVIFAYRPGSTVVPTQPAAGGTVPTWTTIDAATGANTNAARTAYTVATATNHTSGTWTSAGGLVAVVLTDQGGIGGHAESGGTGSNTTVAPAVTMTDTTGTSIVLEFYGHRFVTAWSAAPAGYTRQTSVANMVACNTKDVTTTDGSITQPCTTSTSGGYRGATIEILAPRPDIATLTDDFNAGIGASWTKTGSNDTALVTAVNSTVKIDHTSSAFTYNHLTSVSTYDLTGSAAYVQVLDIGNQGLVGHEANLLLVLDATNALTLGATGANLKAWKKVANATTQVGSSLAFDSVAHRWWRIRESGGTTFWDTAPDGVTWTNRWSATNPLAVTALSPRMSTGCWQAEASGSYMTFDNFNTVPIVLAPSGFFPLIAA